MRYKRDELFFNFKEIMVKKSVRKRIAKRKIVVKRQINKSNGNVLVRNPVTSISARDGMLMNRMNGIVPQSVGPSSQMISAQNRNETLEKHTNDMIKQINSLTEESKKRTQKDIETAKELRDLKKNLKKSEQDAKEAAKNKNDVENYQEEIRDNNLKKEEGESKEKALEWKMKKEEARNDKIQVEHDLKVQDILINANHHYAEYLKLSKDVDIMKADLAARKATAESPEFKNAQKELETMMTKKHLLEEQLRAEKKKREMDDENNETQAKINVLQSQEVKDSNKQFTADIQKQMNATQAKKVDLENILFKEGLKKVKIDKRKKEAEKNIRNLVETQNSVNLLSAQIAASAKDADELGVRENETINKLARKRRLKRVRENKIKDNEELTKLNRQNATMKADDETEKLVNAENYDGKDPVIIALRKERAEERARNENIGMRKAENEQLERINKLKKEEQDEDEKIYRLNAKLNYGNTPQAIAQTQRVNELAARISTAQQRSTEYDNLNEGVKTARMIERQNTIKRANYIDQATADQQMMIGIEAIKESAEFSQDQRNWQNKISNLVRNNAQYMEGFYEAHPEYSNLDYILQNASIADLEKVHHDLSVYIIRVERWG